MNRCILPALVKQAQANLPEERIKTLACDKAADGAGCSRKRRKAAARLELPDKTVEPVCNRLC